jgi:glycosyltransferase involved in cell wall biosynthesis
MKQPSIARWQTLLCQAIVPDYRLPLFVELKRRMGGEFELLCGEEGFAPALRTCADAATLATKVRNLYLPRRTLLWQQGVLSRAHGSDLVIIEFSLRTISTWMLLARRRRLSRPTVMWGHAAGRRSSMKWLKRWMFARCDGFVAYTRSQAEQLRSEFPHLPIWVASNAVLWRKDCFYHERIPARVNDVIYVGRLVPEKKIMLLAEGFAAAVRSGAMPEAARLILVGEGPERISLQQFFQRCGLAARVDFHGHISDTARLRELYAGALVSVSPGYVGLSATQSFSFGVPMLIADREPHSPELEACEQGRNSEFFTAGDAGSLARGLETVFNDKGRWLDQRAQICRTTGERYTLDSMADTFESVVSHFRQGPRSISPA